MDVSVESAEGLQRRIKVTVPAENVEEAVAEKVRRAGQHAKIPGFRPGKVPLKVLYQRYGDAARREATSEIIQSSYPQALEQTELKPAGQPEVEIDDETGEQGLTFTATFDVYPEIELQGLDDIEVEKPVVEVTEADVDKALERLREQHKEYVEVERESRDGDQAVIDYEGRVDGEAFEGGTGNDIEVVLGDGQFLPDLERALVGRKAGESFEQQVTFPEDYGAEELAGKTADFQVTIKSVAESQLPEIDTAFLQKFGIEDGGEAELREKIAESLRQQADEAVDSRVKQQVMDALHERNPIDLPESLVSQEIERMRREAASRLPQEMQQDPEQLKQLMPDESLRESARRRTALGLLLAEVIGDLNIELDREKVDAKLEELAGQYGEQGEQVKQYYRSNPQLMQGIEAMVMEGQVVDALIERAKVNEQPTDLDDLMNPEGGGQ